MARQLGLVRRGKRPLGSAQGEGQAERYLFRLALDLALQPDEPPSFPFVFEEVEGFELVDAFQLDALIGMDILSQCDFEMRRDGSCGLRFGA